MFLAQSLTSNDATTVFALQSYNDVVGSSNFIDQAKGTNSKVKLKAIGPVTHDNTIKSLFCNSETSIYFVNYNGHIEGTNLSDNFNFYNSNFTISLYHYLKERVHDIILLGVWVDNNNYWYVKLRNIGTQTFPTFTYYVGKNIINASIYPTNGYTDTNKWLYIQVVKTKNSLTILHGKPGAHCIQRTTNVPDYLPPLDPNRMKLIIGAWLNDDGTHNSNLAIKGAMNSILIKKSALSNPCLEQGRYKF